MSGELSLLPPPLWGRAGEGGSAGDAPALPHATSPTPNPSPQGGGERTECAGTLWIKRKTNVLSSHYYCCPACAGTTDCASSTGASFFDRSLVEGPSWTPQ